MVSTYSICNKRLNYWPIPLQFSVQYQPARCDCQNLYDTGAERAVSWFYTDELKVVRCRFRKGFNSSSISGVVRGVPGVSGALFSNTAFDYLDLGLRLLTQVIVVPGWTIENCIDHQYMAHQCLSPKHNLKSI